MVPAGEIWSVVTVSPSINNGLTFLISINPSGYSGIFSKKGGFFT